MTETLSHGYSSESAQQELSDEYEYDRIFINLIILVLWKKVASALEGLTRMSRSVLLLHDDARSEWVVLVFLPAWSRRHSPLIWSKALVTALLAFVNNEWQSGWAPSLDLAGRTDSRAARCTGKIFKGARLEMLQWVVFRDVCIVMYLAAAGDASLPPP